MPVRGSRKGRGVRGWGSSLGDIPPGPRANLFLADVQHLWDGPSYSYGIREDSPSQRSVPGVRSNYVGTDGTARACHTPEPHRGTDTGHPQDGAGAPAVY